MLGSIIGLILCLGVLLWAADLTASSGKRLAVRWGVSSLVIGLTLTSVGTSMPELATNVAAGMRGTLGSDSSGLALGNVLGSNLALLTLLLGASAMVHPIRAPNGLIRREGSVLLSLMVLAGLLGFDGRIGAVDGLLLLVGYCTYFGLLLRAELQPPAPPEDVEVDETKPDEIEPDDVEPDEVEPDDVEPDEATVPADGDEPTAWWREPAQLVGGIGLVVGSAYALVLFGTELAVAVGVPDVLIGLGVGIGTSLPELAVTVRAAKHDAALALGNLLGSAVANTGLVLGAGAMVHPLTVGPDVLTFDGAFLLACTAIALLLLGEHRLLARAEGGVLLVLFALYTWLRLQLA